MAEDAGLQQQIMRFFAESLNLDVPSVDTDLVGTGLLDSLSMVELFMHIEAGFGTQISMIDDIEIDNFRSIARITEFIQHHRRLNGTV